jgi:hypothetical protein
VINALRAPDAKASGSAIYVTTTHRNREVPIGRLEFDAGRYLFRYTCGALEITPVAGFLPIPDFPRLTKRYESRELFPIFAQSLPEPGTAAAEAALRLRGLSTIAVDPMTFLHIASPLAHDPRFATRPCLRRPSDGQFTVSFLAVGPHPDSSAAQRFAPGQPLTPKLLLRESGAVSDVILIDQAFDVVSTLPAWLGNEVAPILRNRSEVTAVLVQVNPAPAPDAQRLLIRLTGVTPPSFAPMQSKAHTPILV